MDKNTLFIIDIAIYSIATYGIYTFSKLIIRILSEEPYIFQELEL